MNDSHVNRFISGDNEVNVNDTLFYGPIIGKMFIAFQIDFQVQQLFFPFSVFFDVKCLNNEETSNGLSR